MQLETRYLQCLSLLRESPTGGKVARAASNSACQAHEFLRTSVLRSCTLQLLPNKLTLRNSCASRGILDPCSEALRQPSRQRMTHMPGMYSHDINSQPAES